MDFLAIFAPIVIFSGVIGGSSVRIINSANEALVERLGQFDRKLDPGLNFVIPLVEKIVVEETSREKYLDIPPQKVITADNVPVVVDGALYWQILDLESAYYNVEGVEDAISNLVITILRSEMGKLELEQTFSSRDEINQALLQQLDDATASWGVKVTRVEVSEITPPVVVLEALEQERAAKSQKQAALQRAEGTVKSIEMISQALQKKTNSQQVLQYLIAQRYVDASQKVGESDNAKVLFMNPGALNEAIADLLEGDIGDKNPQDKSPSLN